MIAETRYPENLFEGSPDTLQKLRDRIEISLSGSRPQF
jgi:hypothetical protein